MKLTFALLFFGFLLLFSAPLNAQLVTFYVPPVNDPAEKIVDFDGTPLRGTNFWAQLYSADGHAATADDLHAAGIPVNFRSGVTAGFVQASGFNARGQQFSPDVAVSQVGGQPVSVQVRAWSGPFLTYEEAKNGGGRFGSSRILRMVSNNRTAEPPTSPPELFDAEGRVHGFSLGFGIPALSINDVVVSEGTNGTVQAKFNIWLTIPAEQTINVDFATSDGWALAGSDYVATNGTLNFAPGETNKTLSIYVTADEPVEVDEDFYVTLSNPVNAALLRPKGTVTLTQVHISSIAVQTAIKFNTVAGRFYTLEQTENPATGPWTSVEGSANIQGTGGIVTVIDFDAGCSSSRIYRARLLE